MKKTIKKNDFKLSITHCCIYTYEEKEKYKTVLFTDQFGKIESYEADSKQEALKNHALLVEYWKNKLANSKEFSNVKIY